MLSFRSFLTVLVLALSMSNVGCQKTIKKKWNKDKKEQKTEEAKGLGDESENDDSDSQADGGGQESESNEDVEAISPSGVAAKKEAKNRRPPDPTGADFPLPPETESEQPIVTEDPYEIINPDSPLKRVADFEIGREILKLPILRADPDGNFMVSMATQYFVQYLVDDSLTMVAGKDPLELSFKHMLENTSSENIKQDAGEILTLRIMMADSGLIDDTMELKFQQFVAAIMDNATSDEKARSRVLRNSLIKWTVGSALLGVISMPSSRQFARNFVNRSRETLKVTATAASRPKQTLRELTEKLGNFASVNMRRVRAAFSKARHSELHDLSGLAQWDRRVMRAVREETGDLLAQTEARGFVWDLFSSASLTSIPVLGRVAQEGAEELIVKGFKGVKLILPSGGRFLAVGQPEVVIRNLTFKNTHHNGIRWAAKRSSNGGILVLEATDGATKRYFGFTPGGVTWESRLIGDGVAGKPLQIRKSIRAFNKMVRRVNPTMNPRMKTVIVASTVGAVRGGSRVIQAPLTLLNRLDPRILVRNGNGKWNSVAVVLGLAAGSTIPRAYIRETELDRASEDEVFDLLLERDLFREIPELVEDDFDYVEDEAI